jgi:hypothetical protein
MPEDVNRKTDNTVAKRKGTMLISTNHYTEYYKLSITNIIINRGWNSGNGKQFLLHK